jgi:FkbM family methyltransferase
MSRKVKYSILKFKSYLRKKLFGEYAVGVIYDTKNGKIMAPIDDMMVGKKLGFDGEYDMAEVDILKDLITETDTVYIVGVHWGTLLLPLSKYCNKIIGYEANPITFNYLETNLFINKIKNVLLFNNAAGDMSRKVKFYASTINSGGSKIMPKTDKYIYNYDNPDTIEVNMVSIDEHKSNNNLPDANGIIMDIEGAEFYALQGMTDTLKSSRFLYIEYVPHHLENVSNTTNQAFFSLILPYYDKVKFMNNETKTFDLRNNNEAFFLYVDKLKKSGRSDNLLFTK